MNARPSSIHIANELAAFGLRDLDLPARPLTEDAWVDLMQTLWIERLLGFAQAAAGAGVLRVDQRQASDLGARHHRAMTLSLQVEAELLDIVERLHTAGVRVRVLKGPAAAHLDYPDPSLRSFTDIDLLITPDQIAHALDVVASVSMYRDLPERGRGFDRRFAKEVTLQGGGRIEVDVHRTLVLGPFGLTIDLADLWAEYEPFDLAGRRLLALDPPRRFLNAALAAVCSDPHATLRSLRDIAQMATSHRVDLDVVRELSTRWRTEGAVSAAIRFCQSALGPVLPDDVLILRSDTEEARQKLALSAYGTGGGSNTTTLLAGTLGLPWRDRLTYLRMLIFPSRAYRHARRAARRPREWSVGLREVVPFSRARLDDSA